MELSPGIIARGPWREDQVHVSWNEELFEPPAVAARAADQAIKELAARGSPSHDGMSMRLVDLRASATALELELQPIRWALRLSPTDALQSLAAMCAVRAADGRWLAGRRADWLASWPGRWALGAGGSVDPGESPVQTLHRELAEEWSVRAQQMTIEALLLLEQRLVLFIGVAWLAPDARPVADSEHSGYAWWPPQPDRWPSEADGDVREMGLLLAS